MGSSAVSLRHLYKSMKRVKRDGEGVEIETIHVCLGTQFASS